MKPNKQSVALVVAILVTVCISISPNLIKAQEDDFTVEPVGQFGGMVTCGDVQGDYAYLGQKRGMIVVNISDGSMQNVGHIGLPQKVLDLQVEGNYAYALLDESGGFYVIDISDPASPDTLGSCNITTQWNAGIYVAGQYAYIAAEQGGFQIVDVSNPSAPTIVKTVQNFYPSDIFVANGYAYALRSSTSPAKLRVFNLTDPINPTLEGFTDVGKGKSVYVAGNYAYVACVEYTGGENGMRIVNVTDPTNPTQVSYYRTNKKTFNIIANGDYAHIAMADSLYIANVTDKANPIITGKYATGGRESRCIHYDASRLYLAVKYGDTPLQIVDVADPASPQEDATMQAPDEVISLKAADSYLYISSFRNMFVYNLDNPSLPSLVKTFSDFRNLAFLQTKGSTLFGMKRNNLFLINCSAPANLWEISQYTLSAGDVSYYAVSEDNAFLQTSNDCLEIVDISDQASPEFMTEVNLAGTPRDVAVKGNYVYSAFGSSDIGTGVEIFDVTDTNDPSLFNTFATSSTPTCLWIEEDTLLVGGNTVQEEYTIQAFDISDPANPHLLAENSGSGRIWDVEVRNGAILAAVEGGSVVRFDLSVPTSTLQQVAACHSPGSLQITTTPPGETGYGTLYTSEGQGYMPPTSKRSAESGLAGIGKITSGMGNYGEYGVVIRKFKTKKPAKVPTLTLLKNSVQYKPICPICDTCEVEATIAQVTIAVDEVDSWQVATIGFQAWGSGDEVNDVRTAVLYEGVTFLDSVKYTADDGSVTLSINKPFQPGEVRHFRLTYKFKPDMQPINKIREYNVKAWIGWLVAEPDNYTKYKMLPPEPFDNGTQFIAPVKNLQTVEYFANIQDAIDDDDTKDGHTVVACPGIYQENVVVNKSISLASWEGRDFTTIYAADNTKPAVMITANNSSVHGFTVSNGWAPPTSGMLVINYQGITISGCEIYANKFEYNYNGLHLSGAENCLVRDNIFQNNKCGILLSNNSSSNTIGGNQSADRNIISGNEIDGIDITGNGTSFNKIKGNYIGINEDGSAANGNKQNGIHISTGASDNIVGSKNEEEKNIISGNDSSGVLIEGAGSDRNLVQGNYIGTGTSLRTEIPNKKYGIEISGGASSTVIGDSLDTNAKNYIYHNKRGGVYICGNGTDNTKVSHNRLVNNVWFGLGMKEGCQHTLLYRNEIIQNIVNGVFIVNSDNNQIVLNQIKETVQMDWEESLGVDFHNGHGVKIENGNNNNINNNVFEKNGYGGLSLKNSSKNKVYENIFKENVGDGIELLGLEECGQNNIFSNSIQKNYHGVAINYWCGYEMTTVGQRKNRIDGNDIFDNRNDGVYISKSDNNIVINNRIHSNNCCATGIGIQCYDGFWNVIGNNQIYEHEDQGIFISCGGSNTISTNSVYSNGEGILLSSTEQNLVDDNDVNNNNMSGGISLSGSKYNHITNNRLRENSSSGIGLGGGEENVIRNNDIDKSNRDGSRHSRGAIFLDGSDRNIITENNCHHTIGAEGIFLYESSENSILKNIIQKNETHGIQLQLDCWNNLIENNQILSNNKKEGVMGFLAYAGIHFWKSSNYNVVRSNKIWYNCSGIKEEGSHDNAFINNSIHFNMCIGTGIHVYGSNSIISGNSIIGDQGSAIHCEDGASPKIYNNSITDNRGHGIITETGSVPLIYQNNIVANDGFGLRNADSSVTIHASNNWWGDAAGPGGAGPGAGDQVNGAVDFSGWRNSPVALVVSSGADTVFVKTGTTDSVFCTFQNWENLNDVINVTVTADSSDWLPGPTNFTIALRDSMGADTLIYLVTPADADVGTSNKIKTTAVSQSDPTVTDTDSFYVIVYNALLASIVVSPDTALLRVGQTQQFTAQGYDSFGSPVSFQPLWSATGGTISQAGVYTAGEQAGTYLISAEDPETRLQGQAQVRIILPGDFNADGRVWTEDFVMFVTQFGRQQGDEEFDPIYDLDGDGRVWTGDFSIFVAQFGKTSGAGKTVAGLPPVGKNQNAQIGVSVHTRASSLSARDREFTVELSVENATELRGYGLTLDYDSQSLEFLGATPGKNNLLNKAGGSTPLFLVVSNPDRPGQVWIANALADSKPAQGNGLLVSFSFRTRGRLSGSSLPISFSGVELFDAQLHLNSISAENLTKQIQLVPGQNRLAQNYPNPFNAVTCINYQLAQPAFTTIKVYNLSGQLITTLVEKKKPAGWYSVRWDGRDNSGRAVASGIYFYHLSAGGFSKVHKLLLLK